MLIYKDGIVADYRNVFPNTSFPPSGPSDEFFAENGAIKINVFLPHDRRTEKLAPTTPYIQDGWCYTVEVQSKTPEEIQADKDTEGANVRAIRNQKLADCDWTQGKDIPDSISTPWAIYRQELRDVPKQIGFPYDITWPSEPTLD